MKRIRLLAAVAAAVLIGVLGVSSGAAPAVAAPHTAVHAVAAAPQGTGAPQAALTDCAYHSGFFTTWYGNCASYTDWYCTEGNSGSINPPSAVSNDCGHRVWLYQYTSHTGYTLCISRHSRTGTPNRAYRAFWVSSNTAGC